MEITEKWAAEEPGFFGSVRQLLCCAKCGEPLPGGQHTPRKVYDMFKPTMHFICNGCFDSLPE
jgi:hypothetical protein